MRFQIAFVALLFTLALAGCSRVTIPNTDVDDTAENRKIIEFCEEYRRAVENRKIGLLFSLAHPSYYENGGNIDATDDIDYAGLKEFLKDRFDQTRGIRYEIRYRSVSKGPKDTILVDYTYSASYKIPTQAEDTWHRQVSDNRLELVPVEDSFLIVAGM
jgi:hypothetical protein